jgi:hypothetical protein
VVHWRCADLRDRIAAEAVGMVLIEGLDVKDDPLVAIAGMIPWESLRPKPKASLNTGGLRASDVARKSPAGRRRNTSFATASRSCGFSAWAVQRCFDFSSRDGPSAVKFLGLAFKKKDKKGLGGRVVR